MKESKYQVGDRVVFIMENLSVVPSWTGTIISFLPEAEAYNHNTVEVLWVHTGVEDCSPQQYFVKEESIRLDLDGLERILRKL